MRPWHASNLPLVLPLLVLAFVPGREGFLVNAPARAALHATRPRGGTLTMQAPAVDATQIGVDRQTLSEVLATTVHAAKRAGALIVKNRGAAIVKSKFNTKDLLTEVDGECQRVIQETVADNFPEHTFLGEESVEPGVEASAKALEDACTGADWLWIVDPIDGTTNFVHDMPLSAVSIGVAYRGNIVVGCIYDPYADEMFTACKGQGAHMNGLKIQVGAQATIGEATVAAGAPPNPLSLAPSVRGWVALAPLVRTTRMIGSAAVMLAWVACGRLTCYWEPDLNAWDTAAGALLIQEAGGVMTGLDRTPYGISTRAIIGSNGLVHEEIIAVLEEARATKLDEPPA